MKHKWAKEAIAFFSGETIQLRDTNNPSAEFKDWDLPGVPPFDSNFYEFRIKPKEVVMYKWSYKNTAGFWLEPDFFAENVEHFIELSGIDGHAIKRLDYTATSFPADGE